MNEFEKAALPSADAVLGAFDQFLVNLGPDPLKAGLNVPGALAVFNGTLMLQGPAIATAEFGAVITAGRNAVAAARAKIKAAETPPAA